MRRPPTTAAEAVTRFFSKAQANYLKGVGVLETSTSNIQKKARVYGRRGLFSSRPFLVRAGWATLTS
jgi:hypothetical protein